MPDLGRKYTCYSCHTKFYDLGKPVPLCPKCGADQRDAEDAPVVTTTRSRSRAPVVVEEPVDEPEFSSDEPVAAPESAEDEEEPFVAPDREEAAEEEEEEEEF
ncbi:MAG TPA: FYDLN acid domain-containing protein [Thermoanaerobaculia bacterium]